MVKNFIRLRSASAPGGAGGYVMDVLRALLVEIHHFKRRRFMDKKFFQKGLIAGLIVIAVLGMMYMGCSSTIKERREEPVKGEWRGSGKYYHFDDVLIPGELNYKQKKSFIYETPHFKTGVMIFSKWRLDVGSLIDFFTYNMEKDNWKLVNSFRGKESVFNFSKPDKICTIKVTEKWYGTTEVEIRVGPLGEKKM
jgi:hypothetical protein